MAEENQVTKEPQGEVQQIMKEPQGKAAQVQRVTKSNCKKREVKKKEEQSKFEKNRVNQYYGIGAVIALGVIGGLGYYIYQTKKVEQPRRNNPKPHQQPQTNKFEMD